MENENILYAAWNNNIDLIKKIVTSREIANQRSKDKTTALHLSSYQGFYEITSILIEREATLDSKDSGGRTALHLASIQNKLPIVKLLVEKGCNINAQDKKKNTALHYACLYGNLDIVKFLLSQNAKTNYQDNDGRSVLHHACENTSDSSAEIIKELLSHGVSINALDSTKATPLHIASIVGNVRGVAQLLESKADANEVDEEGSLAIHNAAFSGNVSVLELLLPYSDKEKKMKDGATPLIVAASVGKIDIIKKLLEMGADESAIDNMGDNVLHKAAFFGHTETFKFLISNVSNVNVSKKNCIQIESKDSSGCNILHKAAYSGHHEIVEMCVEFSRNNLLKLDSTDNEGCTPLHKAANNGHIKIIELLSQQKSVDLCVTDNEGSTLLHCAAFNGQEAAVAFILKQKPTLSTFKDKSGSLPIHNAACSGNEKVVALLTEGNDNSVINSKDIRGYTPLHMAVAVGSISVIDYLVKIGAELSPKIGETPLDTAIIFRREDIALHLIEKGGKSNIASHENFVKQVVAQENRSSKKQVRQDVLNRGIVMFNQKPKKGIQFMINQKLIDENPVSIATFLFNTEGLNSKQVGELLSDPDQFGTSIRRAYLGLLQMKDISIDVALRNFLGAKFRLPGESQRIDRMMESFAAYYHENNPKSIFENTEAVHLLAFAIIMLNTDLHNPAIKKKMTKIEFKGRVLGLNGGKDFPSEKLDEIYEKILNDEIKMDAEGKQFTNAEKKGWLVKQGGKFKNFKKRWFILNDNQLFYFKKATETTTPLGIIPLENLNIKKDPKIEFGFRLEATSGSIKAVRLGKDGGPRKGNHAFYLIKANDEKERESWIEAISTNIHRNPFYELITKRKNPSNI